MALSNKEHLARYVIEKTEVRNGHVWIFGTQKVGQVRGWFYGHPFGIERDDGANLGTLGQVMGALEILGALGLAPQARDALRAALADLHGAVENRADPGKRRQLTVSPHMEESLETARKLLEPK